MANKYDIIAKNKFKEHEDNLNRKTKENIFLIGFSYGVSAATDFYDPKLRELMEALKKLIEDKNK